MANIVSLVLAAAGLLAGAQPPAARLYLATEHSPPSSMLDGATVVGSGTDKIRAMMARAGIDYTIAMLPWKRAYASALARADACVYSTTRTPEREQLFHWVGPTDEGEWVLFGSAERAPVLRTLDDARGLRVGTYSGDARDEYLRARGFDVHPVQDDVSNPRKLIAGRIDLWAVGVRSGKAALVQHGWGDRIVPLLTFKRIEVYLACNRQVPPELIARMNAALEAMDRDGSARRIERKYEAAYEHTPSAPPRVGK